MEKPYFVIIHSQDGLQAVPLISNQLDEGERIAMFETSDEAVTAAWDNDMATAFGFDVFQMGCGLDGGDGL